MDRALYLATNQAMQTLVAMRVNNNNLANVNTPGFRADLVNFESIPVNSAENTSRIYSQVNTVQSDLTQGPMLPTGRDLDVAIKGSGWLAIQGADNSEAYTRAGHLQINSLGILTTGDGRGVMGNSGPIALPPAKKIQVGNDGTISIIPASSQDNKMVTIDRLKLVNPAATEIEKGSDGLFYAKQGAVKADGTVQVTSGMLEGSNVTSVQSLVQMLDYSRTYQMQMKMMQTVAENADKSSQLMQVS